jgi:hypothetical protein
VDDEVDAAVPPAPVSTPPTGDSTSWPRTAPAAKALVRVSVENAEGFVSIWSRVKPCPVSVPCGASRVVKGRQPELTRVPVPSSSGSGSAIRGGPACPTEASWMCVAVLSGDW